MRMAAVLALGIVSVGAGCAGRERVSGGSPVPGSRPGTAPEITVFAAASLTDVLDRIASQVMAENPGLEVRCVFEGTQVLLAQLESGATPDVLVTASREHMDLAVDSGWAQSPVAFGGNRLQVAAAPDGPVRDLDDLAGPDVKIVIAVPDCPVGGYTQQCLDNLAALPQYGQNLVGAVKDNVVSEESTVKFVLAKVVFGEADAGFVYQSDLAAAGRAVREIRLPDAANVQARYYAARCAEAPNPASASLFVDSLMSEESQSSLESLGFIPAGELGEDRAGDPDG